MNAKQYLDPIALETLSVQELGKVETASWNEKVCPEQKSQKDMYRKRYVKILPYLQVWNNCCPTNPLRAKMQT